MTRPGPVAAYAALALLVLVAPAVAQAHNPFGVGISEGGGGASGVTGWILAQQGGFERSIAAAVKAGKADGSAVWSLMGISFVYGVLHAAGPGHGKAVLAAYMVANRRALRRGIVLSCLAALLQAGVAIGLVAALSLVFHATAIGMRNTAAIVERLSYIGITLLGAWMLWRKGGAFLAEWRARRVAPMLAFATAGAGSGEPVFAAFGTPSMSLAGAVPARRQSAFACDVAHEHSASCGHCHALDPGLLGDGFSWREALSTVAAAGARPCSGAILVLVFGLAQGMFVAGILSTLVMALGTALTTAALASTAVLAKTIAFRLAGTGDGRGALAGRALECIAAALVLAVGLSLLFGLGPLQGLA